ncbi:MAG TPA: XRE family transcriptional regulator [Candidatus Acidoferrales bacterium]|nr:XRE family transcriptional regulator [Candidatus Acidoferrales bacterium]
MAFVALQDGLRRELRRRIAGGELTGMQLARKTGFTQAHISNFINGKRGLKLRALDRMLKTLGLSVYDLLDPRELARHSAVLPAADNQFGEVPLVGSEAAASAVIVQEQVRQSLKYRRAFLERLRASAATARSTWTRFLALQVESEEAKAMWPEIGGRATLLVDRHYTSLEPYRSGRRNIYVVQRDGEILVRFAEASEDSLILQPRNPGFPAVLLPGPAADRIIGRVAQISLKL